MTVKEMMEILESDPVLQVCVVKVVQEARCVGGHWCESSSPGVFSGYSGFLPSFIG